jgi:hypothetical protein
VPVTVRGYFLPASSSSRSMSVPSMAGSRR